MAAVYACRTDAENNGEPCSRGTVTGWGRKPCIHKTDQCIHERCASQCGNPLCSSSSSSCLSLVLSIGF